MEFSFLISRNYPRISKVSNEPPAPGKTKIKLVIAGMLIR